jgi:hypothetical protein
MQPGTASRAAAGALGVALALAAPVARGDDACSKLAAAHKVAPTAATALALGDCFQKAGRTAHARVAYGEAHALARRSADEATQRLKDLDDRQPKILLDAPGGVLPGTAIRLDGIPLDPAAVGTAIPVEPGAHLLEVARGEERRSIPVQVEASGTARVPLPWQAAAHGGAAGREPTPRAPAEPQPPPEAPPRATAVHAEPVGAVEPASEPPAKEPPAKEPAPPVAKHAIHWEAHRISGAAVSGAGLVTLVTGVVFGVEALTKKAASNDGHCNAADYCDATGRALRADAMHAGNLSTITLFAGGAAIASGAAIFFTAPPNPNEARPGAGLGLRVGVGDVRLVGRF